MTLTFILKENLDKEETRQSLKKVWHIVSFVNSVGTTATGHQAKIKKAPEKAFLKNEETRCYKIHLKTDSLRQEQAWIGYLIAQKPNIQNVSIPGQKI